MRSARGATAFRLDAVTITNEFMIVGAAIAAFSAIMLAMMGGSIDTMSESIAQINQGRMAALGEKLDVVSSEDDGEGTVRVVVTNYGTHDSSIAAVFGTVVPGSGGGPFTAIEGDGLMIIGVSGMPYLNVTGHMSGGSYVGTGQAAAHPDPFGQYDAGSGGFRNARVGLAELDASMPAGEVGNVLGSMGWSGEDDSLAWDGVDGRVTYVPEDGTGDPYHEPFAFKMSDGDGDGRLSIGPPYNWPTAKAEDHCIMHNGERYCVGAAEVFERIPLVPITKPAGGGFSISEAVVARHYIVVDSSGNGMSVIGPGHGVDFSANLVPGSGAAASVGTVDSYAAALSCTSNNADPSDMSVRAGGMTEFSCGAGAAETRTLIMVTGARNILEAGVG